jgi:hypothetical protein
VGRDGDGGYLVDARSVDEADVLVGLGISEDWSFEEDFAARRSVSVYAFDPTIGRRVFRRRMLRALLRPHRPALLARSIRILSRYDRFFKGRNVHIAKYVGRLDDNDSLWLSDIFTSLIPDKTRVFLKVDIEGSEYRILDEMIDLSERLTGAVIEFHDVDLHMDRIERFVARFPLMLCHVHANNYGGITRDRLPVAIECSFTSHRARGPWSGRSPHSLDMPNDPCRQEFEISFV